MDAPSSSLAKLHAVAEAPSSLATLPAALHSLVDSPSSELVLAAAELQALAPVADAPSRGLASVPAVLLPEVVRWQSSPLDIGRLDCTARLFHLGAPRSAVEEGLRLRAEDAGRAVEETLPDGETSWSQCLLWEERRLLARTRPVASSGATHSAFVDAGGQLLTCGTDGGGACVLGQGEGVEESAVPRAVVGLGDVRMRTVAVGDHHTLACSDEGVVYSFGLGDEGRLGHGDEARQHTPKVIETLKGVHISVVAAGWRHSLALSVTGELYSCGNGQCGALGHGDHAHQHGDHAHQHTPRLVGALHGVRISAVAASLLHSLALSEAGEVYSFGQGRYGLLGHGDEANQRTPLPIAALQGVRVCGVAAGEMHSLVVSTSGRSYSFGHGGDGALGHGVCAAQHSPRLVEALHGVRVLAVAAGQFHSLALSVAGEVYSFGRGDSGELGHGDMAGQRQLTPRMIAGLQGVRVCSVTAGDGTSLTVTVGGEVYGWGCAFDGEGGSLGALGLELTNDHLVPCKYPGLRLLTCVPAQ